MTIVLYTYFNAKPSASVLTDRLNLLPSSMKDDIKKFHKWEDSLSSLYGKLLLQEGFIKFGNNATLNDLQYSPHNKPYLSDESLSFNISHSGNFVVCAMSDEVDSIGVDVEKIKKVDINDFQQIWTEGEWDLLMKNDIHLFYEYWTRKEAVIKADGKGMTLELDKIDVRNSIVELNDKLYFLKSLDIHANYVLHISSIKSFDKVDLIYVSF